MPPSSTRPPPCLDAGPTTVTVRFDVQRTRESTGHKAMRAILVVPAMGVHDDVFDSPSPNVCASTVDQDGERMRLRCVGDLVETRGEVVRESGGVRIRVTSGYFGRMPPGSPPGWVLQEKFLPTRCGARVLFGPHTLSDSDPAARSDDPGFYRELTEPTRMF